MTKYNKNFIEFSEGNYYVFVPKMIKQFINNFFKQKPVDDA
jgi:hypothetical protein